MIEGLIHLVIYLIVAGLILWLLMYIVDTVPMFSPFRQVARIIIVVIGCIILIMILLQMLGGGGVRLPKLT